MSVTGRDSRRAVTIFATANLEYVASKTPDSRALLTARPPEQCRTTPRRWRSLLLNWKHALLSGAAVCALLAGSSSMATASCVLTGATSPTPSVVCSDPLDTSTIRRFFNRPLAVNSLSVGSLARPITSPFTNPTGIAVNKPDGDVTVRFISSTLPGSIGFFSVFPGSLNSESVGISVVASDGDISVFSIANITAGGGPTTNFVGRGNDGIRTDVDNDTKNVNIISIGDIIAGDDGIDAFHSDGMNTTIDSIGNITAGVDGIIGHSDQNVTITSTGNIMAGLFGIFASNQQVGAVTVRSRGDIRAGDTGIDAGTQSSSIAVTSTGNITAGRDGISSEVFFDSGSVGAGDVTVTSSGNITAGRNGIVAFAKKTANVTVKSGKVQGGTGAGIIFQSGVGTKLTIGSGAEISATSGMAILNEPPGANFLGVEPVGDIIVNNFGTVIGNVDFSANTVGRHNFLNDGSFNSGANVHLGTDGFLFNGGTLSPGGTGSIVTTALNGAQRRLRAIVSRHIGC